MSCAFWRRLGLVAALEVILGMIRKAPPSPQGRTNHLFFGFAAGVEPVPALRRMPPLTNDAVGRDIHHFDKVRAAEFERAPGCQVLRIASNPQRIKPEITGEWRQQLH